MKAEHQNDRKRLVRALDYLEAKHYPTLTDATRGQSSGLPLALAYQSITRAFVGSVLGAKIAKRLV